MKPMIIVPMLAALALAASAGHAQPPQPPPPSVTSKPMDAAERRAVVARTAETMRTRYIYPDVGARAAAKIEAELAAGRYDDLTGSGVFAQRLTDDLFSVAHDKHLHVMATDAPRPPMKASPPVKAGPPPPHGEGGVVRADRLPGDIGYLEVVGFPPPALFRPPVDRAMTALGGTKALIIDLRRNGGGSPEAVTYLVSWFVGGAKPVHINDLVWRNPGTDTFRTERFYSVPTAGKYLGRPIYLLTSDYTFSGGEEFSYDMQTLKLATLVGAVTGGGANPGGPVPPIGDRFDMFLPAGRAQNPITGTNWEGVGVKPDVVAPVDAALDIALARLGQTTAEPDVERLSQARLFSARTTAAPGSEAALRRLLDGLAKGAPDYTALGTDFAQAVRDRLPAMQADFDRFGAVQSVAFREVDVMGGDTYEVTFAKGRAEVTLLLQADGKIAAMMYRPL